MSQTVANDSSRLELDKAFRYAVTLAWQDFMKPIEPRSIRVEYVCESGNSVGSPKRVVGSRRRLSGLGMRFLDIGFSGPSHGGPLRG